MQLTTYTQSLHDVTKWVNYLKITNSILFVLLVIVTITGLFQNKIVLMQIPSSTGSSGEVMYEKNAINRSSQRAIILATVSAISQINPSNYEFEKVFVQNFLAPEVYSSLSIQIDQQAKKMRDQHELGSYYFDFKEYLYDPLLDKHFVKGEIHTVNAIKNSTQMWIYELSLRVDNYKPIITSLSSYPGSDFHNSNWLEIHNRDKS
jgi:conjugal transfer pilus assembly protein TraE